MISIAVIWDEQIYPFHNGTNVLYEKKIREKCGGILEGRSIIEVKKIAEVIFILK